MARDKKRYYPRGRHAFVGIAGSSPLILRIFGVQDTMSYIVGLILICIIGYVVSKLLSRP
jgi:hypothetical protein